MREEEQPQSVVGTERAEQKAPARAAEPSAPIGARGALTLSALAMERLGFRQIVLTVGAASLLTNVLLAAALITMRPSTETILIPPTLIDEREAWTFTDKGPSANYTARLGESVISMLTTLTPATVDHQRARVLAATDPAFYAQLEAELVREGTRIKRERLTTAFSPLRISVDADARRVAADGEFVVMMGEAVTRREMKRFTVSFSYQSGRLAIKEVAVRLLTEAEKRLLTLGKPTKETN